VLPYAGLDATGYVEGNYQEKEGVRICRPDDFFGGQRLEQAPIYSGQGHGVYNFKDGLWAAADATYFTGGAATIGGERRDNKLDNWRFGLTLTLPIDRYNSLKPAGSSGVSTRSVTDYDAYLLAWQHRWGGGF
jgi:hypothetical protein